MVWLLLIHWKVLVLTVMVEGGELFRRGVCWTSQAEYRNSGAIGTVSFLHGTEKRLFSELYWNQCHRVDRPKQWTALHILLSKFRLPQGFHCRHQKWTNAPCILHPKWPCFLQGRHFHAPLLSFHMIPKMPYIFLMFFFRRASTFMSLVRSLMSFLKNILEEKDKHLYAFMSYRSKLVVL